MTELEREKVLFERAQARQARLERARLAERLKALEEPRPARAPSSQTELKRKRLAELKERRDQRSKLRRRRARGEAEEGEEDLWTEEGEVEEGEAPSFASEGEETEESEEDEEERYAARHRRSKATAPQRPQQQPLTLELANQMRLTREMVERWQFHPKFDELARGMLARLNVGRAYRPVEIKRIVAYHRTYQLGGTLTNKAAVMRYGRSERTFCLEFLSNGPMVQAEWDRWLAVLKEEGCLGDLPPFSPTRVEAWRRLESEPIDDETVSLMVAQRKQLGLARRNLMAERTMLAHQLEEARAAGNEEETANLTELLAGLTREIEEAQAKRQPERMEQLAQLNRKNRETNVSQVTQAQRRTQQEARSNEQRQNDPFSRRKILPSEFPILPDNVSSDAAIEEMTTRSVEKPKEEQEKPKAAPGKAAKGDKVDHFSIHSHVDINIDL